MSSAARLSLLVALCLSACATHGKAPPTTALEPQAHGATFAEPSPSLAHEEPPPPLAEWDGPDPEELMATDAASASPEPAEDAPRDPPPAGRAARAP